MKKIMFIILPIIIFVLLLIPLSYIFRPALDFNANLMNYTSLKKDSLDVLFIGDSNVHDNISPMQIYKMTGITSYNYSTPSTSNTTMYYMLKEALKSQNPSVVIMNQASVFYQNERKSFAHAAYDSMPNDEIKKEALNDSYYNYNYKDKIGFYIPFFFFHDRWKNLSFSDITKLIINKNDEYAKGFNIDYSIKSASNSYMEKDKDTKSYNMDETALKMILKSKQYCEDKGITFILISSPDASTWTYSRSQTLKQWASDNNVKYIDFNTLLTDIGIDYTTDSRDGGMHLNLYGATKLSDYIGNILQKEYKLTGHFDDDDYSSWDNDLATYLAKVEKKLEAMND